MRLRKSWREKLVAPKDLPKVIRLEGDQQRRWGVETLVVPAPVEVDRIMASVPAGSVITVSEIRERLAEAHGADAACPMTTGIFAWISAHADEEAAVDGETEITPYWRTLKSGGELNPKYPGGIDRQRRLLEAEGHQIVARGKRWFVAS